jgi:hypothetical protein
MEEISASLQRSEVDNRLDRDGQPAPWMDTIITTHYKGLASAEPFFMRM